MSYLCRPMEQTIVFSNHVILLDVAFLNDFAVKARRYLGERLGRALPAIDLPVWLSCIALDAGLHQGDNEIQVILVHNAQVNTLACCEPSTLSDLNAMACRISVGELAFACVTPAGITGCDHLFLDLMTLALDAGVKHLMLIPQADAYDGRMLQELDRLLAGKSQEEQDRVCYFAVQQPVRALPFRCDLVFYSLAHVWGINPE